MGHINLIEEVSISLDTKLAILTAAERLWAEHGIDGVSLRKISLEAGCANVIAVQYHFGSKDGLIRELFKTRLRQLEMERSYLLNQLLLNNRSPNLTELLRVLLAPESNVKGPDGKHVFAGFQLNLTTHGKEQLHLYYGVDAPVTISVIDNICKTFNFNFDDYFKFKLVIMFSTFWLGLINFDRGFISCDEETFLEIMIRMCKSILLNK